MIWKKVGAPNSYFEERPHAAPLRHWGHPLIAVVGATIGSTISSHDICYINKSQALQYMPLTKTFISSHFKILGIEFDYDPDDESEPDLARYGFQVDFNDEEQLSRYQKWLQLRPKIWSLFEDPSSKAAKVCH